MDGPVEGFQTFDAGDPGGAAWFANDASVSLRRGLAVVADLEDAVRALNEIAARSSHDGGSPLEIAAVEGAFTPDFAAAYLMALMSMLDMDHQSVLADERERLRRTLRDYLFDKEIFPEHVPALSDTATLVEWASRAVDAMTRGLEPEATRVADHWREAADHLDRSGRFLTDLGHADEALACTFSAANLYQRVDLGTAERALHRAMGLLARTEAPVNATTIASGRAHVLARLAREDETRRRDGYDAFEIAIRWMRRAQTLDPQLLQVIETWLQSEAYLRPLVPIFWTAHPESAPPEAAELVARLDPLVDPVWAGSLQEWFSRFDDRHSPPGTARSTRYPIWRFAKVSSGTPPSRAISIGSGGWQTPRRRTSTRCSRSSMEIRVRPSFECGVRKAFANSSPTRL